MEEFYRHCPDVKGTSNGADKIEFAPGVECLPIPTATLPRHPYQLLHHRQGQESLDRGSCGPERGGFEILKRRLLRSTERENVMGVLYTPSTLIILAINQ